MSSNYIHNTAKPDGAAARTTPAVAGKEAITTQSQAIAANSADPESGDVESMEYGFVTFDPGRKHLARVVLVSHDHVRRRVGFRRSHTTTGY